MQTAAKRTMGEAGFSKSMVYDLPLFECTIPEKENYTYNDYSKLPEGAPYQLIGGQLIMTPSPVPYHQEISRNLEFRLLAFVEKNRLGHVYNAPLDVYFSDTDVYQPDIIFIRKEREDIIGEIKIEGPPDIVIEILSPSNAYYDLNNKFKTYEIHGVSEYWIVDPGLKKIEVYENQNNKFKIYEKSEGDGKISSKVLKGFNVALDEIF